MDLRESIINQNDVAFTITKRLLLKEGKEKNVVFSPLSIHIVLSIIAAGSGGQTLDQLLSFLRSNSTDELNSLASQLVSVVLSNGSYVDGPRLNFVNSVWLQESLSLNSSFKHLLDNDYKAAFASVDFVNKANEVNNEVNSWAEKETCGLIKELLPLGSVSSLTRLIFANALYFKGAWCDPFDAEITRDGDFHLLNGNSVKVPFMRSGSYQFIGAFDGFKILGLPYEQGEDEHRQFSMYLLLPDAKDGLSTLVEKLCSESGFLEHKLPLEQVEVRCVRIPRFKFSFHLETSDVLEKLGLVSPFSFPDGQLTAMLDTPGQLYVSHIFHKSFIEVNEDGTAAAAATEADVLMGCSLYKPEPKMEFIADHPFLFLIREDKTGAVLFIGQVLNPLA